MKEITQDPSLSDLLHKPITVMSGQEFAKILHVLFKQYCDKGKTEKKYVHGVSELSAYIGCCPSTIFNLKQKGVLDEAVVSRVGKKIVFDADKAWELASKYREEKGC